MIALMVITDGRFDYLQRTLASAEENLIGDIGCRFIINDAFEDEGYLLMLQELYGDRYHIWTSPRKLGFAGAIQTGWDAVAYYNEEDEAGITHIFHLEGDFLFNRPVNIDDMVRILDETPGLAQLALLRQAWNEEEKAAGGIIQLHPDWYEQVGEYTRHSAFFTTNPTCYSVELTKSGWPQCQYSEGHFGISLKEDNLHFGFFQSDKSAAPSVHHIGEVRVGVGY